MRSARQIHSTSRDHSLIGVGVFVICVGLFGLYDTFAYPVAPPPKGAGVVEANMEQESVLGLEVKPGQEEISIMFLGTDERKAPKTNYVEGRADSIIVVIINKRTKRAAAISVPRDLEVNIPPPHSARTKINAAFAFYMHEGKGEEVTGKIVSGILGIPIDYYIKATIDSFPRMIDTLGGVDLDVDKDMNYDDSWGHLHVHLRKGFQHLGGEQATGFARHRHDNDNRNMSSDYERSRRQMYLAKELMKQKAQPTSVLKLPALAREVIGDVTTNLTFSELVSLGILSRQFSFDKIKTAQVPVTDGLINGVWLSQVRQDALDRVMREVHASLLGGSMTTKPVAVLNGSGEPGLAQTVSTKLKIASIKVGRVANASRNTVAETVIHYPVGMEDEAADVQRAIGMGRLEPDVRDQAAEPDATVTVILGRDVSSGATMVAAPAAAPLTPAPAATKAATKARGGKAGRTRGTKSGATDAQ
jgi:LCP family protein required for cell wall assembly